MLLQSGYLLLALKYLQLQGERLRVLSIFLLLKASLRWEASMAPWLLKSSQFFLQLLLPPRALKAAHLFFARFVLLMQWVARFYGFGRCAM